MCSIKPMESFGWVASSFYFCSFDWNGKRFLNELQIALVRFVHFYLLSRLTHRLVNWKQHRYGLAKMLTFNFSSCSSSSCLEHSIFVQTNNRRLKSGVIGWLAGSTHSVWIYRNVKKKKSIQRPSLQRNKEIQFIP